MKKEYSTPTLNPLGRVIEKTLGNGSTTVQDGSSSGQGTSGYAS